MGYGVCFTSGDPGRSLTLSHVVCRWRTGPSTSWRPSTPCRSTPGWRISRTASTLGKPCWRRVPCGVRAHHHRGAFTTQQRVITPDAIFLLLGVLQKVPDSRQQKSGGKAGSLCVSEVQPCSELAASSPSPAPRRLGQAEAGDPGTQPSTREALNTHPLKLFYYIRAVFYAFFPTPASVVYLRFCWLNRFIYVSVTVALTLSLESQQLCQNFSSALGYAVGRFACPSAGSASPGPRQAGSAQALPGLRGNPSTALLGTVLGNKVPGLAEVKTSRKPGTRARRGSSCLRAAFAPSYRRDAVRVPQGGSRRRLRLAGRTH